MEHENENKYSRGKIYKIVNDINDEIYVGSTVKTLSNRMAAHRSCLKISREKNRKIYKSMIEHGVDHFRIILIELFPCSCIEELRAREDFYIRELNPTLNLCNAVFNHEKRKNYLKEYRKEYYGKNRDVLIEYQKEYRKENADIINAKKKEYYYKPEIMKRRKEYLQKNAENIRIRDKKYRARPEINERKNVLRSIKIDCDYCGYKISKGNLKRHKESNFHKENEEFFNNVFNEITE